MAWSQLDITKPHLVYIILGGFTSLFMLCSTVIKERMYIGEATVATLCGVIFGPHAANLIDPKSWGSTDIVTIEFSRIVLVVQCFAVGVELPKFYMEKHWKSVVYLLLPVMTVGWLIVSLFIWWLIPPLSWLDSLVVAACVTATDPVLASSVVGKGKFAKRVPKHLRDLLSAESGCNDGMAFPFIYLSLYLLQYHRSARDVSFHFVVYVVLYECIFGAVYGFLIGYIARHGIKYAEKHELVDRESFLVFYFVLALFCAGSGSILGVDDLLVGFAAGVGFSNDGWFQDKTEESHVSNVIDLLLNLAYFVYLGTIIPWEQYNNGYLGMDVWRLVAIALLVIFFRRIPVMMLLKPFIPDIKTWREALFAGHFGPIGVGAIFVAIMARAELEHDEPIPLGELPPPEHEFYNIIYLVWPITTFLVITSIVVHGSSVAVFTLGKRINTLTLTMSYTAAPEDGPSWMNRLPRISSQSRSQAKTVSEASFDDYKDPQYPPGTLAPPTGFLRRQKDDSSRPGSRASSLVSRRRKHKKWDDGIGPGGPVSQSAIFPNRQGSTPFSPTDGQDEPLSPREKTDSTLFESSPEKDSEKMEPFSDSNEQTTQEHSDEPSPTEHRRAPEVDIYDEGDHLVFETHDGDVLAVQPSPQGELGDEKESATEAPERPELEEKPQRPQLGQASSKSGALRPRGWTLDGIKKKVTDVYSQEVEKRKAKEADTRKHEPARAYQFGNTIIVEDEDGEVVKTYELPSQRTEGSSSGGERFGGSLKYIGLGGGRKPEKSPEATAEEGKAGTGEGDVAADKVSSTLFGNWAGMLSGQTAVARRKSIAAQAAAADDENIRFKIAGVGQRMTKDDFLKEVRNMEPVARKEAVDNSDASQPVKQLARMPARRDSAIPRILEQQPSQSPHRFTPPRRPSPDEHRGRSTTSKSPPSILPQQQQQQPSEQQAESAVERRRRLAVLGEEEQMEEQSRRRRGAGAVHTAEAAIAETPAERRRREAALGMGGPTADDSDSEDEGDERVPPARRGIRFAETTRRG